MAIYRWSLLANGQTVNPFNPNSDVLQFDSTTISAASVAVQDLTTRTSFSFGGKTVSLQPPLFSTTTTNVRFDDGSLLLVGDNSTGTTNDNTGRTLTGGAGADQLIGGAGDDTL